MPLPKTRRTISLPGSCYDDIALIKQETGLRTDVAVIADALKFTARLLEIDCDSAYKALAALSIYRQLQAEVKAGGVLYVGIKDRPETWAKLVIPLV